MKLFRQKKKNALVQKNAMYRSHLPISAEWLRMTDGEGILPDVVAAPITSLIDRWSDDPFPGV